MSWRARARSLDSASMAKYLEDLVARYPDRLDRGRHGRGRLGRLEGADRPASASKCQLVGDDLFVTNTEASRRRHREGRRQLDPGQGQPDRHADRDARRGQHGAARRLHRGDVAPLRRDRGFDHRRPRGRHELRARSRPARCRAPTDSRNTTSSSASRRNWAISRFTQGGASSARLDRRPQNGVRLGFPACLGSPAF